MTSVRIGVGSENPVKVEAVKEAFLEYFDGVEVVPVKVNSFDQPFDGEVVEGAHLRAKESLKTFDFGVGLEGGVVNLHGKNYLTAFCSIINSKKEGHGGWSPLIEIPEELVKKIKQEKKELGVILDEIHKRSNIKQSEGAFGIWTKGRITRKDSLKMAVLSAICWFLD